MADRTRLDYEPVPPPREARLSPHVVSWVLVAVFCGGLALWLTAEFMPHRHYARATANRAMCANNLREIGLACSMYANDSGHVFPDSLLSLVASQRLTANLLVCPGSADVTATGSTPAQQAAGLATPGCCSYVYVGAPLTDQSSASCIVAWDDPADHQMDGALVLYADGSAAFELLPTIVQLVPELEAGHNPPNIVKLSQAQAEAMYNTTWKPKLTAMKTGLWAASLYPARPPSQRRPAKKDRATSGRIAKVGQAASAARLVDCGSRFTMPAESERTWGLPACRPCSGVVQTLECLHGAIRLHQGQTHESRAPI